MYINVYIFQLIMLLMHSFCIRSRYHVVYFLFFFLLQDSSRHMLFFCLEIIIYLSSPKSMHVSFDSDMYIIHAHIVLR